MNRRKLLTRLAGGECHNVAFHDMMDLVRGFGFQLVRTRGSHHIFQHNAIPEQLNLQEVSRQAKPFQIRQFLRLVERHNLRLEKEEE